MTGPTVIVLVADRKAAIQDDAVQIAVDPDDIATLISDLVDAHAALTDRPATIGPARPGMAPEALWTLCATALALALIALGIAALT